MTDDIEPRTLAAHDVIIEPTRKGWAARSRTIDVTDRGRTPHEALARLLADAHLPPAVIPPAPTPCRVCGADNAVTAHSPPGTDRLDWYCDGSKACTIPPPPKGTTR